MKSAIRAVLFDLDNTLWDFAANANVALNSVWKHVKTRYDLQSNLAVSFKEQFWANNHRLWKEYREGSRDSSEIKVVRFQLTICDIAADNDIGTAVRAADIFMQRLYNGRILVPGAVEILEYLYAAYPLGLITNGFADGLGRLELCNIGKYFRTTIASEEFGKPKPHPDIFVHAATEIGCSPMECVYIGDNYEGDVVGAKQAGFQAIFFNRFNAKVPKHSLSADYVVSDLLQIKEVL